MQSQTLDVLTLSDTRLDNTVTECGVSIEGYIHLLGVTGVVVVAVLPFTFVTSLIGYKIRSDLSDSDLKFLCIQIKKIQGQIISSFKLIHQLSYLISSRSSWERPKRKMLNQKYKVI